MPDHIEEVIKRVVAGSCDEADIHAIVWLASGRILLRNSYYACVRLLGQALVMVSPSAVLLSIRSLYWESFFTNSQTFQTSY